MFCKNCGQEINDGVQFCPNCGTPTANEPQYSAPQQQYSAPQQQYTAPQQGDAPYLAGQDKTTMILICLFLGGLGIHNFMMGESKKGVTRIIASLCFGLGYILAIIDLVKICTDKYVVDPNAMI